MIDLSLDDLKKSLEDNESQIHYLTISSQVWKGGNSGEKDSYSIKGLLPREITISTSSDWSAPLDQGAGGSLNNFFSLVGVSFKSRVKTAQVWQGTSPLEVDFTFPLIAEKNANDDVLENVKKILKMPLPSTVDGSDVGRFIPPGPSFVKYLSDRGFLPSSSDVSKKLVEEGLVDQTSASNLNSSATKIDQARAKDEELITVKFGNFLTFENVIILSSNVRLSTQQLHHTGIPIKAEVDLRFRMYTVPSKNEIDNLFRVTSDGKSGGPFDLSKLKKQSEKSANSAIKSKFRGLF